MWKERNVDNAENDVKKKKDKEMREKESAWRMPQSKPFKTEAHPQTSS